MSCQLFRGLPVFLFMLLRFQFKAWFGILQSSILIACPSHLSLLSFIISSSFVILVMLITIFPTFVAEIYGVLLPMSSYV